jgi:hypothetical protein
MRALGGIKLKLTTIASQRAFKSSLSSQVSTTKRKFKQDLHRSSESVFNDGVFWKNIGR